MAHGNRWCGGWLPVVAAGLFALAGDAAAAPGTAQSEPARLSALVLPDSFRLYVIEKDRNARLVSLLADARVRLATGPRTPRDCAAETLSPGCLIAEALVAAEGLASGKARDLVLADIAVAQAIAGDVDGALTTLAGLDTPAGVAAALVRVAEAAVEAGESADARRIAWALPGAEARVRALIAVAARALVGGDVGAAEAAADEALAALPAIEGPARRALLLADVATVEARIGRTSDAVAVINLGFEELGSVPEDEAIGRPLARLATALAAAGRPRAAIDTLATVPAGPEREAALMAAVGAEARTGRFAAAMVRTASISDAPLRVAAFVRIAHHQARSGDLEGARSTLALARRAVDGIVTTAWRSHALSRIALGYAAIDTVGPAIVAARAIVDQGLRARTLWVVAARVADAPTARALRTAARATADTLGDPVERTWLLGDLALAEARADGDEAKALFGEAVAMTRAIAIDWARARALARLAIVAVRLARPPAQAER